MTFMQHPQNSLIKCSNLLCIFLFVILSGCSTSGKFFEATAPENLNLAFPPETLVKKGMEEYNRGKYFVAIEYFNKILESHRFSPQAILAELKVADCHYYMDRYAEAYVYYEQFEEMHPTNEAIPYVMYQKAMSYYKRIDTIDRDITGAEESIIRFQRLLQAYPDSVYAKDAKEKINHSREFLANHEFAVAKFYIRTKQQPQAIIRLKYLLNVYPNTKIVSKAETLLKELEEKSS